MPKQENLQAMVANFKKQLFEETQRVEALMGNKRVEKEDEAWEDSVRLANEAALEAVQRHMPVDVRSKTELELVTDPTPNGKRLPRVFVSRFKHLSILQLLRRHPDDIEYMSAADLQSHCDEGLSLTERRAVYGHLVDVGKKWREDAYHHGCDAEEAMEKWFWFRKLQYMLKRQIEEYCKEAEMAFKHSQLPREADMAKEECPSMLAWSTPVVDYFIHDFGFPVLKGYENATVEPSAAASSKMNTKCAGNPVLEDHGQPAPIEAASTSSPKESARYSALALHYNGNAEEVRQAEECCEAMDTILETMGRQIQNWSLDMDMCYGEDKDKRYGVDERTYLEALHECKLVFLHMKSRNNGVGSMANEKVIQDPIVKASIRNTVLASDMRSVIECTLASEVYNVYHVYADVTKAFLQQIPEKFRSKQIVWSIDVVINISMDMLRNLDFCNKIKIAAMSGNDDELDNSSNASICYEDSSVDVSICHEDSSADMFSLGGEEDDQQLKTGKEVSLYHRMVPVHEEIHRLANNLENMTFSEDLSRAKDSFEEVDKSLEDVCGAQGEDSSSGEEYSLNNCNSDDLDSSGSWSLLGEEDYEKNKDDNEKPAKEAKEADEDDWNFCSS